MTEEVKNKTLEEEKKEAPKSGLLLNSEELRQVRERYAATVSDGGGTGVSDSNDNQNQMI